MTIYLGADHNGYDLKNVLREHLTHHGYKIEDVGARTLVPTDDYPQYAFAVASKLIGGDDGDGGILICASGQGMAMAANRVGGIRAAIAWNKATAVHAKRDDNANILVLPARYATEEDLIEAVDGWLGAEFSRNPKYSRRINQIEQLYG